MALLCHLHPSLVLAGFCKPLAPCFPIAMCVIHSFVPHSHAIAMRCGAVQAPADFAIALYTQQDLLARLSLAHPVSTDTRPHTHRSATRVRYARLRAVHAGVPTPGLLPSNATVPLMLVLEPAYLGVLPASLLPTVCVLLAVLCVALACVVPRVLAYVEPLARQASADLHAGVTRTRKEQ